MKTKQFRLSMVEVSICNLTNEILKTKIRSKKDYYNNLFCRLLVEHLIEASDIFSLSEDTTKYLEELNKDLRAKSVEYKTRKIKKELSI